MNLLRAAAITAVLVATASANGQTFSNLGFEAANVSANTPPFGFLPWSSALPGWSHSAGADTATVYYGLTHTGVTQWYLLTDSTSQPQNLLAGSYSAVFASGYASSNPQPSQWVNAYLAQSADIPVGTRSLVLLARGPLEVYVNGALAPLVSLGGLSYGIDLSPYAGSFAELKFLNTATALFNPVAIDSIAFSNVALVPEPAGWAMFALGLAALGAVRRKACGAVAVHAPSKHSDASQENPPK
jgi:hypothetical protein